MWQYAITRAVAEKNDYSYGINRHPDYDYYNHTPQLDFFEIDYGKEHNYSYHQIPPGIKYIWEEQHETRNYSNGDTSDWYEFQPNVFEVPDDTKIVVHCGQDARYLEPIKENVRQWFKIKNEVINDANLVMSEHVINLDRNLVVCNLRGGEYKFSPQLYLTKDYWYKAINQMQKINPASRFICITDDVGAAKEYFDFPCYHFSIAIDYFILHHSQNLILSNSSFALLPCWLSTDAKNIIAPRFWSRWNVSTGYWPNSAIWTFGFKFLDRDGKLYEK